MGFRRFVASVMPSRHVFTMPNTSITGLGILLCFHAEVVVKRIPGVFPQLGRFYNDRITAIRKPNEQKLLFREIRTTVLN